MPSAQVITWKELHEDRGVNFSSGGDGATRGWAVNGATPDVASTHVQAPRFGDAHPDNPGLKVNSVSFVPIGYGTRVTAQYVPVEYLDRPPPEDTTAAEYAAIDTTLEDVDIEIPVYQNLDKEFPSTPPGTTQTLNIWQPVKHKATFRYSRTVHRITLNAIIQGGFGVDVQIALSDAIQRQNNKLHTINGKKYLFKADGVRRVTVDKYQFTYRWIDDPGVPNTMQFDVIAGDPTTGMLGAKLDSSYYFPFADPAAFPHPDTADGYLIPPYHRVDTAPHAGDPTLPPIVSIVPSFIEDPTGWQTLPGVV